MKEKFVMGGTEGGGYGGKAEIKSEVETIVLDGLKIAGSKGTTFKQLLELVEGSPSGKVAMEVGEEMVPVKYTAWDEVPGHEGEIRPIVERQSVYDADDLEYTLEQLEKLGRVRVDHAGAERKFYLK